MAEKKISAIKSITLNSATFHNKKIENPTYINFFFGKNGAGKTSISREIELGEGITWNTGESAENYEILVYNQDFIDSHFKTLDRLKGIFSLSEGDEDKEAKDRIEAISTRKKEIENRRKAITVEEDQSNDSLSKASEVYQKACNNNTKHFKEKYSQAMKGALKNPQLSQKILTTVAKDCEDEAKLEKLYNLSFSNEAKTYRAFQELNPNEHIAGIPKCELLNEVVTSSGTSQFASFVKQIQALDWISEGHNRFHGKTDGKCPYCQQPLISDFEEKLMSCFDEEYRKAVKTITGFRDIYRNHMAAIYNIVNNCINQETLPSLDEEISRIKLLLENFAQSMKENMSRIDGKIDNPSLCVQLEDLSPRLIEINTSIQKCNKVIKDNNDIVAAIGENKIKCSNEVWGLIAYRMQGEVKTYKQALADENAKTEALRKELNELKEEDDALTNELKELSTSSATIQAAILSMNKLLEDSGFEGFRILSSDIAKDAYKVVRPDNNVAVRLSDGENHFLSFLYFYSLVKGCDSTGSRKEKIIVIDDPVSSLDGNALFIISSIVREMIEICYNNSDYRAHKVNGDYIRQLFILTHNAHFHRSVTYNQVGRYECVNFYKINKFNNESDVRPCIQQSKDVAGEMENYNPVKNAYAALWTEYRELQSEIPLMNVIHRILDFYFLEMCGEDGMDIRERILVENRNNFIVTREDGTEDTMRFHLANSMLQYMSSGVESDMSFVSDGAEVDQIKKTFEMIFEYMGQGQHYKMMMERSR